MKQKKKKRNSTATRMVSVFQGKKGQTFYAKKFSLSFPSAGMFTRSGTITILSIITGILVTQLVDSPHW